MDWRPKNDSIVYLMTVRLLIKLNCSKELIRHIVTIISSSTQKLDINRVVIDRNIPLVYVIQFLSNLKVMCNCVANDILLKSTLALSS